MYSIVYIVIGNERYRFYGLEDKVVVRSIIGVHRACGTYERTPLYLYVHVTPYPICVHIICVHTYMHTYVCTCTYLPLFQK